MNRPNREPDFTFTSTRRVANNGGYKVLSTVKSSIYWKEALLFQQFEEQEYAWNIVVTEFGRIDMRYENHSHSISHVKGLKENYENFVVESILLS